MNNRTNQEYLRTSQYRDANNLNARINLHRRFSTNPTDWFRWVFDHFNQRDHSMILEIGCGPGLLWKHNLDRISKDWWVHLTDFSLGMLREAHQNLQNNSSRALFCNFDAQEIPYQSNSFDLVIANHMLYHIPDRQKALSEIHRVLKPLGRFIAATNGKNHMMEIRELMMLLFPTVSQQTTYAFGVNEFTIENGTEQLSNWFSNLEIVPFEDSLKITETNPLLAYILSMSSTNDENISDQVIQSFRNYLEREIKTNGSFHITKSTALFIGEKKLLEC